MTSSKVSFETGPPETGNFGVLETLRYQRQLERSRGLAGKIVVNWEINDAGLVTTARVKSNTMGNPLVGDCVVRQVRSMKFPTPKGGSKAVVNYPFIFAQQ